MPRVLLLLIVVGCAFSTGCTAIHSYNAARDFNPRAISVSGTLGSGVAIRDRDGDGKSDGVKLEKVLVPDAKANIKIHAKDFLQVGVDPLPPSIGLNVAWRFFPDDDKKSSLTIEPSFNYLVWPHQRIYSIELPVTFARRVERWLVVYGGPKGVYQSNVLSPDTDFPEVLWMRGVPDRPDQDLRFVGGFAGVAVGWLHFQVNPEIDYFYDVSTGEQVILAGIGVRLAL